MNDLLKDLKENNEKFSEEYYEMMRNYYEKMVKTENQKVPNPNEPDEQGGITITPTECFCLKTKDVNGQKIFLNITSHEKIDAPKEEHILEVDNKYGVRLPLSLSERYEDFDNNNQMCQVYDVIFNPNIVKKGEEDPMVLQFIMQVVAERIKQKNSQELSQEFVKLKKLKFKGKAIRSQRIRYRKGPKIEEVIKPDYDNQIDSRVTLDSKEVSKEVNQKSKTPAWNLVILQDEYLSVINFKKFKDIGSKLLAGKFSLNEFNHNEIFINKNFQEKTDIEHRNVALDDDFYKYYNGSNATPQHGKSLIYIIEMNLISKSIGISLNISDNCLVLNCSKIYNLELNLPFRINSNQAYSVFEPKDRQLYIILPFYEKDVVEMQAVSKEKTSADQIKISDDYIYDLIE